MTHCIRTKLIVVSIVLALGGIGLAMLKSAQPIAVPASTSHVLLQETPTKVTTAVKTYAPSVKAKLALPKAVQDNGAKVVLTSTDLPTSKHERSVTTVLDQETGEAVQYVQEKPLPLFAKASTGNIGAYVGFKNTELVLRVAANQDLFTVKAVTFGAVATVDINSTGRTNSFIGVGARLDW